MADSLVPRDWEAGPREESINGAQKAKISCGPF